MFQVTASDVRADPFPHVVAPQILPPDLYARLRADYPSGATFRNSNDATGGRGSRTGVGTGFDIYRGDSAYADMVMRSSAWAELDAFVNSQAFVDQFLTVFESHLAGAGCAIDVAASKLQPDYWEPRSALTGRMTLSDRVAGLSHRVFGHKPDRAVDLYSRLDVQKAVGGYKKPPHCDRPNRLCSLIIYFSDTAAQGIEGGNLRLYRHRDAKPVHKHERHPAETQVEMIAELTPSENLGVWFPCSNHSYHGVTPVTTKGAQRDFLYINLSGRVANLWSASAPQQRSEQPRARRIDRDLAGFGGKAGHGAAVFGLGTGRQGADAWIDRPAQRRAGWAGEGDAQVGHADAVIGRVADDALHLEEQAS